MNKIIFLDIDWVLITSEQDMQEWIFNQNSCNNLMYILEKTWAKLVISSSWRHNLEKLKIAWENNWLDWNLIIWVAPSKTGWWRDEEILQWLRWNEIYQPYKRLAIDDCYFKMNQIDMLWSLVRTNFSEWITRIVAEYAIQKLNTSY